MSQFSVSGAISGLDTATLINQLMAIEGQQQQQLQTRQTNAQKAADAYDAAITSLKGLFDKASAVARTSDWNGVSATSSSTSVTATGTGTQGGTLTFDVTSVARAHTLISAGAVASTSSVVASGPLTLTASDGTQTTIDVGGGTLSEVVSAINGAGAGLTAAAVQTSPGNYRLQVASATTGAASSFTLAGLDGFSGLNILSQGADAKISVGDDPDTAYEITSSSNTFKNVVPGLSFTVSKLEDGVTVSSTVNGSAVADQVSALVDSVNSVLAGLDAQTALPTKTTSGGVLAGDTTIRQIEQQVLSAVSGTGAPGTQLTRDGKLTFDRQAFLDAFAKDPTAVAKAFGAKLTFAPASGVTGSVTLSRASATTRAGSYAIQVAVAAAREQWRVEPPGGDIAGHTVLLVRGGTMISYTAGVGDTVADAVAALNARLGTAGFGVGAALVGGDIVLTADSAGTAPAFTVTLDGDPATQVTAGENVSGTIDGQTATGIGDVLQLDSGTGGAVGLAVHTQVDADDLTASGGDIGSVTYQPGLAQSLLGVISNATALGTGSLQQARRGSQALASDLQDQVDAWTRRLDDRRASLQRQFATLETTLADLKSQSSALSGLTGLTGS
jgi:flagellar hook-associated protein 2